ncbi:MAG: phosphate acyltransferase, partial [Candidatus Omnitrophota bacterium]
MAEFKKRYNLLLKAIAIAVICLFSLNNLVWANPDLLQKGSYNFNLQPKSFFWATSNEDFIEAAIRTYLAYIPELASSEHHLYPIIKGKDGLKKRVDLFIDPEKKDKDILTISSYVDDEEYEAIIDLEDEDHPAILVTKVEGEESYLEDLDEEKRDELLIDRSTVDSLEALIRKEEVERAATIYENKNEEIIMRIESFAARNEPDHVVLDNISEQAMTVRSFLMNNPIFARIQPLLKKVQMEIHVFEDLPVQGCWLFKREVGVPTTLKIYVRKFDNEGMEILISNAVVRAAIAALSAKSGCPTSYETNVQVEEHFHFTFSSGIADLESIYSPHALEELRGERKGTIDYLLQKVALDDIFDTPLGGGTNRPDAGFIHIGVMTGLASVIGLGLASPVVLFIVLALMVVFSMAYLANTPHLPSEPKVIISTIIDKLKRARRRPEIERIAQEAAELIENGHIRDEDLMPPMLQLGLMEPRHTQNANRFLRTMQTLRSGAREPKLPEKPEPPISIPPGEYLDIPRIMELIKKARTKKELDEIAAHAGKCIEDRKFQQPKLKSALEKAANADTRNFDKYQHVLFSILHQELLRHHLDDPSTIVYYLYENGYELLQGSPSHILAEKVKFFMEDERVDKPVYLCFLAGQKKHVRFGKDRFAIAGEGENAIYTDVGACTRPEHGELRSVWLTQDTFLAMPYEICSLYIHRNKNLVGVVRVKPQDSEEYKTADQVDFGRREVDKKIREFLEHAQDFLAIKENSPFYARLTEEELDRAKEGKELQEKRIVISHQLENAEITLIESEEGVEGEIFEGKVDARLIEMFGESDLMNLITSVFGNLAGIMGLDAVSSTLKDFEVMGIEKSGRAGIHQKGKATIFVNTSLLEDALKGDRTGAFALLYLSLIHSFGSVAAEKIDIAPMGLIEQEGKALKKYMFDILKAEVDYSIVRKLLDKYFKKNTSLVCSSFIGKTMQEVMAENKQNLMRFISYALKGLLHRGSMNSVLRNLKSVFRNLNRVVHFLCSNNWISEAIEHVDFFMEKVVYPSVDKHEGRSNVRNIPIEGIASAYFTIIQKCKKHRPYLLRTIKSIFRFVSKTVDYDISRELLMKALVNLRDAPRGKEESVLDRMRKDREKYELAAEGLKILKRFERFDRTRESYHMYGLLAEESISSFYWDTVFSDFERFQETARPHIDGRKKRAVNETLRRDVKKLGLALEIYATIFNVKKGIRPKRRLLQLEAEISSFRKELLDNPMPESGTVVKIVPMATFFLGLCYRGVGNLQLTRECLESVINMLSARNEIYEEFAHMVIPALLFTYENLQREGKGDEKMKDFLESNTKLFVRKQEMLELFGLLEDRKFDEIIEKYGEITPQVENLEEYLTANLCITFAFTEKGDEESVKQAILDIFNLTENKDEKKWLAYRTALQYLFLPDNIKKKIGKILTQAVANSEIDEKNRKAIVTFLMATRDNAFYEYLKEIFPRTLEGVEINGFTASDVIEMLERHCSVDLYKYLASAVDDERIKDEEMMKKVTALIKTVKGSVTREPEIFLPYLRGLFASGKYRQTMDEAKAFLDAERSFSLLGDTFYLQGLHGCTALRQNCEKILSLFDESKDLYKKHDYAGSIQKLEEVIAINPQDADAHSLLALRRRMQEAEDAYRRKEMDKAIEIAQEVKKSNGDKKDNVPDEFVGRIGEYRRAKGLMENNPQETVGVLKSISGKFPDDPVVQELLHAAEAKMATILLLRSDARKKLNAGDFERAKSLFLQAVRMGKDMNGPRNEAVSALRGIYNRGRYEISLRMAEELLEVYPDDISISGTRNRSRAQIILSNLRPHLQILNFVIAAKKHETQRLRHKFGGLRYSYSGIEFTSDGFTVKGLRYKKEGQKGKGDNIQDAKEIAFIGDSFRIVPADGTNQVVERAKQALRMAKTRDEQEKAKKMLEEAESEAESVDYFEVAEMNGDSITFKFDNIEQRERALAAIKKKGFIEKAEDISLLRQKEALEEALKNLEKGCADSKVKHLSTGKNSLDLLLGLKEKEVKTMEGIRLSLLDERVREDETQMRAIRQGVNPVNEVTLIQGPPGTGKTTTIAEIANYYVGMNQRVLIVSQSNAAVNNVGEGLKGKGVPFARVGNREEKISDPLKRGWKKRGKVLERLKKQYLKSPRKGYVILGTNNGFLNDKYVKTSLFLDEFDVVIVEEAGRATVAETLVPLRLAKSKVILVGDHKQLPAFGLNPQLIQMVRDEMEQYGFRLNGAGPPEFEEIFSRLNLSDFRVSLFERVFRKIDEGSLKLDAHTLLVNRRSHPLIVGLVNIFYSAPAYLKTFAQKYAKLKPRDHNKDEKEKAEEDTLKLIDVRGTQEKVGHSFSNFREIDFILEELERLLDQRKPNGSFRYRPEDITIISPYLVQNQEISLALKAKVIIDKIRSGPKRGIKLTKEEKEVLEACLKKSISAGGQAQEFVEQFMKRPHSGDLEKFLRCLKFKIPIKGRRKLLSTEVDKIDIKVNTIDSIQGQENKVVIVSMVRSNDEGEIGFLKTHDGMQRLNVSMSRAQEKMVIIGDFTHTLTSTPVKTARDAFTAIKNYIRKRGNYVKIDDARKRGPPRKERKRTKRRKRGRGFHGAVAVVPGAASGTSAMIAIIAILLFYEILSRMYHAGKFQAILNKHPKLEKLCDWLFPSEEVELAGTGLKVPVMFSEGKSEETPEQTSPKETETKIHHALSLMVKLIKKQESANSVLHVLRWDDLEWIPLDLFLDLTANAFAREDLFVDHGVLGLASDIIMVGHYRKLIQNLPDKRKAELAGINGHDAARELGRMISFAEDFWFYTLSGNSSAFKQVDPEEGKELVRAFAQAYASYYFDHPSESPVGKDGAVSSIEINDTDILDVGAGMPGIFHVRDWQEAHKLTLLDKNLFAIEALRTYLALTGKENIDIVQADFFDYTPEKPIPYMRSNHVLHHLKGGGEGSWQEKIANARQLYFRKAHSILDDEGILAVSDKTDEFRDLLKQEFEGDPIEHLERKYGIDIKSFEGIPQEQGYLNDLKIHFKVIALLCASIEKEGFDVTIESLRAGRDSRKDIKDYISFKLTAKKKKRQPGAAIDLDLEKAIEKITHLHPKYPQISKELKERGLHDIENVFKDTFGPTTRLHMERFLIATFAYINDPLNDPYFKFIRSSCPEVYKNVDLIWNFFKTYIQPYLDQAKGTVPVEQRENFRRAFFFAPRHLFMPEEVRDLAYLKDGPLEIGEGQTISQPSVVARMTLWLDIGPQKRPKVLEVGTGSGWQAALLHYMGADVHTIERLETLTEKTKKRFEELGITGVRLHTGDGSLGLPSEAPFDRIITTAGPPQIPEAFYNQLAEGGKILCPERGDVKQGFVTYKMMLVTREGITFKKDLLANDYMWVPLVGKGGYKTAEEGLSKPLGLNFGPFFYPRELVFTDMTRVAIFGEKELGAVIYEVLIANQQFIGRFCALLYPDLPTIKIGPVVEAIMDTPREKFIDDVGKIFACADLFALPEKLLLPLPIGYNQRSLIPSFAALLTVICNIKETERVLVVGTGTGWLTAILSRIAKEVVSVERIPELAEKARRIVCEELGRENVEIITGDGSVGVPEKGPFDVIFVTATAPDAPKPLLKQLAEGGRMVLPYHIVGGPVGVGTRSLNIAEWLIFMKRGGIPLPVPTGLPASYIGPLVGKWGFTLFSEDTSDLFEFIILPENPYVEGEVLFAAPDTWKDDVKLEEIDAYVERTKEVILKAAESYHAKTGKTPVVALLSYHTTNSKDTRIPVVDDTSSSLSAAYCDKFEQGRAKIVSKLSLTDDADNAEFDKVYVQIIERAAILAKKEAEDKGLPIVFLGQGNIQFDAAVISDIYERKTGMEAKEGEFPPNVFIFPNRHSLELCLDLVHVGYRNFVEARSDFVTIASSPLASLEAPSILDGITARLKSIEPDKLPRIFFPETIDAKKGGLSTRVISSAMEVAGNGLAKVTLVYHDAEAIKAEFPEITTLIEEEKLEIIDPREVNNTDKTDLMANLYAARKLLKRAKRAKKPAGLVAGAELDTAQIVLLAAWFKPESVSGLYDYFLMLFPDAHVGEQGLVLYANIAVQECPDAIGIRDMAISSAQAFEGITSKKAKIALLTSKKADLKKVNEAWRMLKGEYPDLDIGPGPMTLEEALKAGFNVVIFPDLVSGNIGYKLTQRILGARRALGPIILGTPISDLSRGATNQDIRDTAAVLSSIAASQQEEGEAKDGGTRHTSAPAFFAIGGETILGISGIFIILAFLVTYVILNRAHHAGKFQKYIKKHPELGKIFNHFFGEYHEPISPEERERSRMTDIFFRNAPIPVYILDDEGTIVDCNQRFLEAFSSHGHMLKADEVMGKMKIFDFIVPEQRKNAEERYKARRRREKIGIKLNKGGLSAEEEAELMRELRTIRIPPKEEERKYMKIDKETIIYAKTDDTDLEDRVVTLFQDITESVLAKQELIEKARLDSRTGLYNSEYFLNKLNEALKNTKADQEVSVLLVNLDIFEEIKADSGLAFSTELAKEMGKKLKDCLDQLDGENEYTLAYLDSGVYAIMIRGNNDTPVRNKTSDLAGTIIKKLKQPLVCGGDQYNYTGTISMGASVFTGDSKDGEELVHLADVKVKEAKVHGGNV